MLKPIKSTWTRKLDVDGVTRNKSSSIIIKAFANVVVKSSQVQTSRSSLGTNL